jgi:demethylmenaquinone methyltransferase/2-methoxy-6-polyprenyl-1,4-benzoquinol methylase
MPAALNHQREDRASFGRETVLLEEKQDRVDQVFHNVAEHYDLMNDLLSAGLHRTWKSLMAAAVNPSKPRPCKHLDIAGGTGDIVHAVQKRGGAQTRSTLLDINEDMLKVARERLAGAAYEARVEVVQGNAEELPFPDKFFDACTIAFGIRNVPRREKALLDARRVLKTGGHFLCLEFSQTRVPVLEEAYRLYSDRLLPRIGEWVVGDAAPYDYLKESIRRFPDRDEFAQMLRDAGFAKVGYQNLACGIAALHSAWRI